MAVGVPEKEVFAAADAVLARGERPTVERVRLELGRGSPARVGSLLDQWWEQLAGRLRGEVRLPGLPTEVAESFMALWQHATTVAQAVVEQSMEGQRQVLAEEREQLMVQQDQARQDTAKARQHAVEASTARQAAETRLIDLEQLLAQRLAQIDDLQQQRAHLQAASAARQEQVEALQEELLAAQQHAEHARVAQETYVRGVEERAHREVDRAREDSKSRLTELREAHRQSNELQQRLEHGRSALSELQRQTAAQQARAELVTEQGELQRQALEASLHAMQQTLEEARHLAVAQHARAETLEQQLLQQQAASQRRSRARKT